MNTIRRAAYIAALTGGFALMAAVAQAATVISNGTVFTVEKTLADPTDLWVTPEDFTRINGFVLKPEGACLDELCIPLRQDQDSALFVRRDGQPWLNATAFADKVQQPYVVDRDTGVWSFGQVPASRTTFLKSAVAPDFALRDRHGDLVRLSDFKGKKVLLLTWASW